MMNPTEREYISKYSYMLTVPEMAKALGKSNDTVRQYCKKKGLVFKPTPKGQKVKVVVPYKNTGEVKRHPAVYDNHRPSVYGIAYELHYSQRTA